MNIVTSVTTFNDSVGLRLSASYSEIDDNTGQIISDNKRIDRIVTDSQVQGHVLAVKEYAQDLVDAIQTPQ